MEVLDRLEWPVGLAIVRYGVRIGVRATDAHLWTVSKTTCRQTNASPGNR